MITKWLKIIRAYSLFASACPVLVGGMVYLFPTESVSYQQIITLLITLLCAMSLQVVSNLINDYYDYKKGADRQGRAGFARPLAEGTISISTILRATYIFIALAIILGAYLVYIGGLPILLIGVSALFFAWLYTATRFSLAYLGLGDIFVLIFYGFIASWGTGYLLASTDGLQLTDHSSLLLAGAINGLFSMLLLSANNLRDIEEDRPVGKRTFPVRFGKKAGEILVLLEVLAIPVCAYFAFGWSLPMLMLIPGLLWAKGIQKASNSGYNIFLQRAGLMNMIYTILVFLQLAFC